MPARSERRKHRIPGGSDQTLAALRVRVFVVYFAEDTPNPAHECTGSPRALLFMTITPIENQKRRLLEAVAFGFILLMAIVAVFDAALWLSLPVGGAIFGIDLALSLVMAGTVAGVRYLARNEQYEAASWVLICVLAARTVITVGVIAPEQIEFLAPGYLIVVVLAQVLIGSRGGLIAGIASLPMFALAYLNGDIHEQATLPSVAASSLLIYVTVGGVVQLTLRAMQQAMLRQNVLLMEMERARRDLQDSEKQFRAITESSPTGIIIQQDGHVVYANPRLAEMARCVQNEVYGLSLWDFFSPEDADKLRAQLQRRQSDPSADIRSEQVVLKPRKGPSLWCEVAIVDATYRDREAIVATLLDVSERLRAQHEVQRERDFTRNIIDAADAIIMALDPRGNVLRFNPAGERITGYSEETLRGKPFWEHLYPPEAQDRSRMLIRGIYEGNTRGHLEDTVLTSSGEERIISWHYVAQLDPSGKVVAIITVGIDVTQQRMLERQSVAAERLRALGQMAGGVAHDLNNTLAGIMGPAELLLLDETDAERRHELSAIVAAARRGSETVKRIQRFSQARTDMDRQVFNLRELADDVIHTLRPRWRDQAQREGVRIAVKNEITEDLLVVGSSGEIGNVLTNLIVNACEAMPKGGSITVSGHQGGDMTVFSVRDTGTGIPEDMIDDIFQPFYSTKGADNSGLGLAVIRGIILRHGGNISVESKLGEGTRFTVSLPAAQRLEDHEEAAAPAAEERGPLHILVVDDTRPIADFASTALRRMGHKADTAYDGNAALAKLRENAFDVLLTDYGMEGLSGVSLAREARRMHPNIKTVIMTGWDLAAGEFEGIDAALAKPFTIGQLKELIEEGL